MSDADRDRIEAAVRDAEALTAAEIVVVVESARCEESEATVALLLAGAIAIAAGVPAYALGAGAAGAAVAQALTFAALGALATSSRLRRAVGLDRAAGSGAHDAAERAFAELGLGATRQRTGVLIHVAPLDRRVEVIADDGVHAAVAPETWDDMVAAVAKAARLGRLVDGIVDAVARCGSALADALPPQPGLGNELPNRPVTR